MHPLILQQLAANRVAEMIARAGGRRQERQARGARPARTSRQGLGRAHCARRRIRQHSDRCRPGPGKPSLPAGGAKSYRSLTWLTAEAGSAQPTREPASS